MANFSALKTAIQNAIRQNGNEEITGDVLQQILLSVVNTMGDGSINTIEQNLSQETLARQNGDNTLQSNINAEALARGNADTQLQNAINAIKANIDNGYVYAGIATPSSTPVSGKVFYVATTAGTYTNFGGQVLTQGINILRYNGSAWSSQQLIGIDDAPTAGSNSLVKSGGVQNELALGAVYDVSAKNPTAGPNNDGKFTLEYILDQNNVNTLIPAAYRKGGMSIKFVQSSDNKYVQFRCMAQNFTTDVTQWQGVDDEPTAGSNNLVKSGGVDAVLFTTFQESNSYTDGLVKNEDANYVILTLSQQLIKGYAEINGTFKKIGTASQYFRYISVKKGHTYRVAGKYRIPGGDYADILFSQTIPNTNDVGTVIEASKNDNDTFDVTYVPHYDGYLFVWIANSTTYRYNFYEYAKSSRIDGLEKEDSNIKTAIDYSEANTNVAEGALAMGLCQSNTNKFEYNATYGYRSFSVSAGKEYTITGIYGGRSSGYAGVIFLDTIPSSGSAMCIELSQYVGGETINLNYTPLVDGYILIFTTNTAAVTYKTPVQSILTPSDIFSEYYGKPLKIVGQGLYKPLYVQTSNNKIVSAPSNYSFAIPVLAGEKYLVRGKSKVYAPYAVVSFATSLEAGTIATIYITASQEQNFFPINYVFTAPNNGYLIIWASSGNSYESQNYIEVCKYIYGQDKIYDYYLPTSLTIQTFGDSITDNTWGDHSSWVNYIPDNIHTELNIVNSGVGGISTTGLVTIVEEGGTTGSGITVLPIQSDADIVVILIGTNDWAGGTQLSTSKSNLMRIFQYITEHSSARILFCTPLQRYNSTDQTRDTNSYGEPLNNGISLREFCAGLIEVCNMYSVPVLNLNADAGINRFNVMNYTEDGLHPHRDGDIYVSNLICKKIKEMIRGSI